MRLAAVDIGSNTVHVLVADVVRGKLEDVAHYVEMPELGPQVEAIGAPIRIITPRREAELSFLGVASRHAIRREWAMVDLGGASTEVVIARDHEMLRPASLPIGSGVLAATYLSDPPKPEERARLRRAALRELAQAPDGDVERLVATGGTASNLPAVLARRNPPLVLTTADLLTCEARRDGHKAARVAAEVGLPVSRIRAMRAGVEALLLFLDWYGLALLHVSHEGLRHGMLLAYLERGEDWWRGG